MGGAAAWLASDLLQALLFQVEATDPATFAATSALMVVVAFAAAAVPAWRATRRAPVEALGDP